MKQSLRTKITNSMAAADMEELFEKRTLFWLASKVAIGGSVGMILMKYYGLGLPDDIRAKLFIYSDTVFQLSACTVIALAGYKIIMSIKHFIHYDEEHAESRGRK